MPATGLVNSAKAGSPAALDQGALVLVNSASAHYADFATFIKPYLDQFGVPYTTRDLAAGPALTDLADHALLILGHRDTDPTVAEQAAIGSAVTAGTGLVSFDNDLFSGTTPRYSFVNTIFGFTAGGAGASSDVTIATPLHYITQMHSAGETIGTGIMTLSGASAAGADVSIVASVDGTPFISAATSGSGRAVQWGSYEWMSYDVLGPLRGLDDLTWRSLVWAARKPFVMRGLPPFVTMRMDDVSNPLTWIPAAHAAGFIPWAGVFTGDIDPTEAAGLSSLAHAGEATVALHAFGTSDFFYYDHNSGANWPDAKMADNYAQAAAWFATNNIPASKYLVPHYYEIGSNAFAGLASLGVPFIGTMMDPGQLEAVAPWMSAGPFRSTQAGQAYDRAANPYYADFMTIPGHPEMNGQFFNCMTEIRDITGYEWLPSSDVANSVATGTGWLTRPIDGMELATLFSHEYVLPNNGVTPEQWTSIMAGIAANLAPYHPIYVSMDDACAYMRALKTSTLSNASYDAGANAVTAHFSGNADVATKFYVFNDAAGTISQSLIDTTTFTGSASVTYTLPGPLDRISISPSPASVPAGGSLIFTGAGFDAADNPIPNLDFTWSVVHDGGTIDTTGHFTAATTTGTYPDTVVASLGAISASASVTVTEPVFDHFSFGPIGSPKFAGDPFTVSISARDPASNLVPGYIGSPILSVSSGSVSPTSVGPFSGGTWSGPVSLAATGTGLTLSVTAGSKSGTSNAFDVTTARVCPCSIWPDTTTPADPAVSDGRSIELGLKFRPLVDGYVTGVRFYKGSANTGAHVGHLWTAAGVSLSDVTFAGESAGGWQTAYFAAPIAVAADTTYVVSYYSAGGYFADTNGDLASAVSNPPLRALANGEDGANGLYRYDASGFPVSSWNASNYWVDVVFDTSVGPDTSAPTIVSTTPTDGAPAAAVGVNVTATFSEPVSAATIDSSHFSLRDAAHNSVPATLSYSAAARMATLDPTTALAYSTTYTATIAGGPGGVTDLAGNPLAADRTWTFTTTAAPPPPPDQGPDGPILIVTAAGDPFGRYYTEILRAEGLNEFLARDISAVDASVLASYTDVILAPIALSDGQVGMFSDYVTAGGNLVAMRPDARLASLLGLSVSGGSLSEGYLRVDTGHAPGIGITDQTIQFHGTADRYALAGATSVATLFSDATTATTNPAVTLRSVGSNGGQAAAFTFDLARSVVETRQGNPAYAGQKRDGETGPIRSDDLFYPNWVDFSKIQIPQADEQQRLLANTLELMNRDTLPLPRFWYLPRGDKAVVVMSGDDHGSTGGTAGQFDWFKSRDPLNCSVGDWQCIRSTSYVYVGASLTAAQAAAYQAEGFEVAAHVTTDCLNFTPASLAGDFSTQLADFAAKYTGLATPVTNRTHCIAWSDWASEPKTELANGIRADLNYYYWPAAWIQDRPGLFTGSGLPMRLADADGTLIDVYQLATQMTDESAIAIPTHIAALLDNALGAKGYYGVFTANMHTDSADHPGAQAIVEAAQARGVSVVSASQMLTWLDGRNASSFNGLSFADGVLSFGIGIGAGANGLEAMLPINAQSGSLQSLIHAGSPVSYTTQTIKGLDYAVFTAQSGNYQATYATDTTAPSISALNAAVHNDGTATITWTTDEPADSQVAYGTSADALNASASDATLLTSHTLTLTGLTPNTAYYFRASSTDGATNTATAPQSPAAPASFATAAAALIDTTAADFGTGTNTYVSTTADGEVILAPEAAAEFDGSSLPAGWSGGAWSPDGSFTVAAGGLVVDQAHLWTDAFFTPGRSLEFVAKFSAQNQHAGFANDFNSGQWAIFSTGANGDQLYARSLTNAQTNTDLGASYLNTYHRYRIDWSPTGATFYIDDVQVASHAVTFTDSLRPAASDSNPAGSLTLDWMRMTPYASSATFTSRVFDAAGVADWQGLSYVANVTAGSSLALEVRTGDTPTPDGSWSAFAAIANGADIPGASRYLQYRATFTGTGSDATPELQSVSVGYAVDLDSTAPTITGRAPSDAASDVAAGINPTVTFSEPITPASLTGATFDLVRQGGAAIPADVTYNAATQTATLDPAADLTPGTYTATVTTGVTDTAGNHLAAASTWSFSVAAGNFSDTTVADFNAGSGSIYVSQIGDGEVTLNPALAVEFAGASLPAGWTSTPWTAGSGNTSVANGSVSVDGTRLSADALYTPGRALDFVGTFGDTPFEHAGFGQLLENISGESWAMFSTLNTSDSLYARTNNNGTTSDTLIPGDWLGAPHHFGIVWNASNVVFSIDGSVVYTAPVAIGASMRPVLSEYNAGGPTLSVDWLHFTPYTTPGIFTSRAFDAGASVDWGTLLVSSLLPTGATPLDISVRMGNTATPGAGWTSFTSIANGADIAGSARYLQYRISLATSDANVSPEIDAVVIGYAATPADTTPPAISTQTPGSGDADVAVGTNASATFSEPIDASSVDGSSFHLRAQGSDTDVPASLSVSGVLVTLDPDADLSPATTYIVTVAGSIADLAGNQLGADHTWSFTTAAPTLTFTDTTSADFRAGSGSVYVSQTGDGEVTLNPALGTEFAGASLPASWSTRGTPWSGDGAATLDGGLLAVGGTMVGSNTAFGPGGSLAFVATFNAQPFQHIGFVGDLDFNDPWAIISTGSDGDGVYARTSNGSQISLGSGLLGTAHLYHIDWTATGFDFSVDGGAKTSVAFATAGPMLVGVSDAVGGTPLTVDWLRLTPYSTSATFTSRVFDAASTATWHALSYNGDLPAGTTLTLTVRTGDTPTPDATWSDFTPLANGADIPGTSRYIQYQASFNSSDPAVTPVLQSVAIDYAAAPDTVAPTIDGRSPAPAATDVSTTTNVSVAFSEPLDPATVSGSTFSLTRQGHASPVNAAVTYNAATQTATLDPDSDLSPGALYTVQLTTGLADLAGNHLLTSDSWSFTVGAGAFGDTTAVDFGAGTGTAYVSQTGDGEVILSPMIGNEFSAGPGLPQGWSSIPWTGGTPSVSAGSLNVDGTLVATDAYYGPGRALEFVATFGAVGFEHVGLARSFADGEPWAMFSTKNTADTLFARTYDGAGNQIDTPLGTSYVGSAHRYRIEWAVGTVRYYIDGGLAQTDNVAISANMRPIVSDYNDGGPVVKVDWLRLTPYAAASEFTSRIFDASEAVAWSALSWTANLPAGTGLTMRVRTGDTPTPDASWSAFHEISSSGDPMGMASRYVQYQAALTTGNSDQTPTLRDVALTFVVAALDHIVISPDTANLSAGENQTYSAKGFDIHGNSLGDVTAGTAFSISPDGSCTVNICTATTPGSHTVTGTDGVFSDTGSLVIKAPLTVMVNPSSKIYGATNPSFSVAYAGFIDGDGAGVLGGTLVFTTTATQASPAGDYVVSAAGYTSDKYTFDYQPGTLSIAKASATLSLANLAQTYDGTAKSVTVTTDPAALTGVSVTYNGSAIAPSAVGSYAVMATLDNPDYAASPASDTLVIAKAAPSVATLHLSNLAQTYDGTPKAVTVATDPADLAGVSVSYDGLPIPPAAAGSYAVVATLNNPDYLADPVSDTLVIAKASATLSLSGLAQTYDGTPKSATVATDPVGLAGVNITYDDSAIVPSAAGSYYIDVILDNPNYVASPIGGTLVIAKAAATLSLSGLAQTYDGTPKAVTVTTDPANLDGFRVTYDGSLTAPSTVGSYAVVATLDNSNYTASPVSDVLVIAKAIPVHATLHLSGLTRTYNGSPKSVTVTTDPPGLNGISITYDGSSTPPTDAGSYAVVATLDNPDYISDPTSGTLVIAKAAATLGFSDLTQIYDGTSKAVTVATDPADLMGVGVTYNGSATAPTHAGSYAVMATLDNPNYSATPAHDTLVIAKAVATLSLSGLTQVYDGTPKPVTVGADLLSELDSVSVTYDGSPTAPTAVGRYVVVASMNGADCTADPVHGTLVISKATAKFNLSDLVRIWDGTPKSVTVTTDPAGLDGVSITYDGSATAPTAVGSYAVVVTLNNHNYAADPASGTLVIGTTPDTTPPTVTTPLFEILAGRTVGQNNKAVIRTIWTASDASGAVTSTLQRKRSGGTYTSIYVGPHLYFDTALRANGTHYRERVRASDAAGNTSGYRTSTPFSLKLYQGAESAIHFNHRWSYAHNSHFLGGMVYRTAHVGYRMTLDTSLTSAAIVAVQGPDQGKFQVIVDGVAGPIIDLYRSSVAYRQVVWSQTFATPGTHHVTIKVLGKKNRASSGKTVQIDAFLAIPGPIVTSAGGTASATDARPALAPEPASGHQARRIEIE